MTHLHAHSNYSLLEGAATVRQLVAWEKRGLTRFFRQFEKSVSVPAFPAFRGTEIT